MVPKHPRKQHKQVAGLYRPTRKTGHTRYVIQPTRAFATRIGMLSIAQLIGMLKFIYSEKATKLCEIFTNHLTGST